MSVQPAAVDRAVQRSTRDELNELGRLLQTELKHAWRTETDERMTRDA